MLTVEQTRTKRAAAVARLEQLMANIAEAHAAFEAGVDDVANDPYMVNIKRRNEIDAELAKRIA